MLLNIEKSGEKDKECSKEWLVNTDPTVSSSPNYKTLDWSTFNSLPNNQDFYMTLKKKYFENLFGKGENAGNQHFLIFQQDVFVKH